MNKTLIAVVAASALSLPAFATDIGVSISVGQPGFYGRLDIGGFPPPQLLYTQPLIIERGPLNRPPVYLRVPPGHAKHWNKHCHEYNACGDRVYFVRDEWYNREYIPRYQERRGGDHFNGDHDQYREDFRGNGNGNHGQGHGNKGRGRER